MPSQVLKVDPGRGEFSKLPSATWDALRRVLGDIRCRKGNSCYRRDKRNTTTPSSNLPGLWQEQRKITDGNEKGVRIQESSIENAEAARSEI